MFSWGTVVPGLKKYGLACLTPFSKHDINTQLILKHRRWFKGRNPAAFRAMHHANQPEETSDNLLQSENEIHNMVMKIVIVNMLTERSLIACYTNLIIAEIWNTKLMTFRCFLRITIKRVTYAFSYKADFSVIVCAESKCVYLRCLYSAPTGTDCHFNWEDRGLKPVFLLLVLFLFSLKERSFVLATWQNRMGVQSSDMIT